MAASVVIKNLDVIEDISTGGVAVVVDFPLDRTLGQLFLSG